jgi:hypothetical protein
MEMNHSKAQSILKKQPVRRLDGCTFIRVFVRFGLCLRGAVKYTHHVLIRFHARLVDTKSHVNRVTCVTKAALLIFFSHEK